MHGAGRKRDARLTSSRILLVGDHEYFLEEASSRRRAEFFAAAGDAPGGEPIAEEVRVRADELDESLPGALLHGSLFAARRFVRADLTPLAAPRKARRRKRADGDEPAEEGSPLSTTPAGRALRAFLEGNDPGIVLVAELRVEDPDASSEIPAGDLVEAFTRRGEIEDLRSDPGRRAQLLRARAAALSRDRGVRLPADAAREIVDRCAGDPRLIEQELEKLFSWAGRGGAVTAADAAAMVEDRRGEDAYAFVRAVAERDGARAAAILDRILAGAPVEIKGNEVGEGDPVRRLFTMLVAEVRRLARTRIRCEEAGVRITPGISRFDYVNRVHPVLAAPLAPAGLPGLSGNPWAFYYAYVNAWRFSREELEEAWLRCAEADIASRSGAPVEGLLTGILAVLLRPAA